MHYFDEVLDEPCGNCDVCRNRTVIKTRTSIDNAIIDLLKGGAKSSREIAQLAYPQQTIINSIRLLLEQKKIAILPNNTYTLL